MGCCSKRKTRKKERISPVFFFIIWSVFIILVAYFTNVI